MAKDMTEISEYKDVWVFTEIKDHERVDECALEILGKGREIADQLNESLVAIVLALDAEQYIPVIKEHGVDKIVYMSHVELKHYHEQIFTHLVFNLVENHKPSVFLFPSTEAGDALAARVAYRCRTGLVSDVLDIEINEESGLNLRNTEAFKPAYGGNINVKIITKTRPQMCTITRGTFQKQKSKKKDVEVEKVDYAYDTSNIKVKIVGTPTRKDKPSSKLSDAKFVIGGGHGLSSKENFDKLFELAKLTNGQVGGTRRPIIDGWMPEHLQIGISGEAISSELYIGFGISGAIQHVVGISDSKTIIAINKDPNARIFDAADYCVIGDANEILNGLLDYFTV